MEAETLRKTGMLGEALKLIDTAEDDLRTNETETPTWRQVQSKAASAARQDPNRQDPKSRLVSFIESRSESTIRRWRRDARERSEINRESGREPLDEASRRTPKESSKDLKRLRLGQLEAHSRDLAKVLGQPEVLLGRNPFGSSIDSDLVSQAMTHLSSLGAYPDIETADKELRKTEVKRDSLEGKPNRIAAAFSSPGGQLIEGEAGDLLMTRVLAVLERLYPGVPEQPDSSPMVPPCTFPKEAAKHLWMQVGAAVRHETLSIHITKTKEPSNGCWYVRWGGTPFAIVNEEDQCKATELERALKRLARSRDLRSKYREVREADENLSKATATWSGLVRNLGKELEYGGRVKGTCGFKFEDALREPSARIASDKGGTPPPPESGPVSKANRASDELKVKPGRSG